MTFAHKNEALSFFDHFELKAHPDFPKLWTGQGLNLLITGEGQYETLFHLQKALSILSGITKVLNLGVVGSLSKELDAKSLVTIQTSYLALENKAQFKSFPLQALPGLLKVDCLTNSIRVLDPETRKILSPFAHCVDRELWANAFVCKKNNVSLSAIKVISDTGDEDQEVSLCEDVKSKALEYSELLLDSFLHNVDLEHLSPSLEEDKLEIFQDNDFYFTLSMRRQVNNLLDKIKLLNKDSKPEEITEKLMVSLRSQDLRPKIRALHLAKALTRELNPLRSSVEEKLEQLASPLKTSGWNIKYDHHIEDDWINLSAKVQDKNQLFKLTQTLQHFPLEDWQQVFEGEE